jgi:hypothetical protein
MNIMKETKTIECGMSGRRVAVAALALAAAWTVGAFAEETNGSQDVGNTAPDTGAANLRDWTRMDPAFLKKHPVPPPLTAEDIGPVEAPAPEDWDAAQMRAFGAHILEIGDGLLRKRVDLTVSGHLKAIDWTTCFVNVVRNNEIPFKPGAGWTGGLTCNGNALSAFALLSAATRDQDLYVQGKTLLNALALAQEADGYLGAMQPKARWHGNWDIEENSITLNGLLMWWEVYRDEVALRTAHRVARYLTGPRPARHLDWHLQFELGLLRAYEATGDPALLKFFMDSYFPEGQPSPWLRERLGWDVKRGFCDFDVGGESHHLYAMQCYAQLLAHLHRETGEAYLLVPAEEVGRYLRLGSALTPGIYGYGEKFAFTQQGRSAVDNPLVPPNVQGIGGLRHTGESCSSAWQMMLAAEMQDAALREGDVRSWWMDTYERTLYNGLFAGQSEDGRRISYGVEAEGLRTWSHLDVFCCPNSWREAFGRTMQTLWNVDDALLRLNLYAPAKAVFTLAGVQVPVEVSTAYPFGGEVAITFAPETQTTFSLDLRIPAWAENATIRVNGEAAGIRPEPGRYLRLKRVWKKGDTVHLDFPMKFRWIAGTLEQEGRAALMRGPLVFTFSPLIQGNEVTGYTEPDYDFNLIELDFRPSRFRGALAKGFPGYEESYALLRDIEIDPDTVKGPFPSKEVHARGIACSVVARIPGTGEKRRITLTEFPDEQGRATYFKLTKRHVKLQPDPLFSPRKDDFFKPVKGVPEGIRKLAVQPGGEFR